MPFMTLKNGEVVLAPKLGGMLYKGALGNRFSLVEYALTGEDVFPTRDDLR
jgi:hypothetical protein